MIDFLLMVGGALFAMFVSGIVNYGKRTWVGLTDEEVIEIWLNEMPAPDKVFYQKLCRSVEAKLKEKNT